MKNFICILFVFFSLQAFSQSNSETNQLDQNGKKTGFWIENKGRIEVYYKNGLRHGVLKAYNRKNGKLAGFGEYSKGVH